MQPPIHVCHLSTLFKQYPAEREIWAVDVDRQQLHRLRGPRDMQTTPVSTSRFGWGQVPGSLKTPLGPHRICQVIGIGAPPGQRFKDRQPFGEPLTTWREGKGDAILTRILWLDGMLPELNATSKSRYIYIHGTHQEEQLGEPASQGCIRMGNLTLADWADALGETRPLVWIGHIDRST